MRNRLLMISAVLILLVAVVSNASATRLRITKEYAPVIDPNNFVSVIDNPFFPLEPGTTFIYEGETSDGFVHNEIAVTNNTKVILGVTTTEVHDTVFIDDVLVEDTLDWFAQDKFGNVWYFGEDSKELDPNGNVISTEGSWEAGVDDAFPGIIMLANPRSGDAYRQEFAPDVAEDVARVLSLHRSVSVPYGDFSDVLLTKETTPLERGFVEHKYYAEGVGLVLVVEARGSGQLELVDIITP